jgi:mevalonate kinase
VSSAGHGSGKVILLGEHAVVYGVPALAAGIALGARAEATPLASGETSRARIEGAAIDDPADARLRAFHELMSAGGDLPPLAIDAHSDLPLGAGLGSSAALGVAIARAAISAAGRAPENAEVIARADAWERVFHGNPSGIDVTAAATGGCFRFVRGEGSRPIHPARDLVLAIGLTGVSASTREMVEGVARLKARKPDLVERSLAGIASLVENAALAIEAGDLIGLGKLMDLNQMLLAGLMLSTEAIEELCSVARGAGALGAKLTGKGGGGSVIALVDGDESAAAVLAAWKSRGYQGITTRIASRTIA